IFHSRSLISTTPPPRPPPPGGEGGGGGRVGGPLGVQGLNARNFSEKSLPVGRGKGSVREFDGPNHKIPCSGVEVRFQARQEAGKSCPGSGSVGFISQDHGANSGFFIRIESL